MGTDVTNPVSMSIDSLEETRDKLRELAGSETPVANSIDGVIFNFESPLASAAETGGYVDIEISKD
jgi:hypothetical protein